MTDQRVDGSGDVLQVDAAGDTLQVALDGAIGAWISGLPAAWSAKCRMTEPGQDLVPPTGGRAQRIDRLGSRYAVTFDSLPALGLACARQLMAARVRARANSQTLQFAWPQPLGAALGAPATASAGQLGTQLGCGGFSPGVAIPAGSFFSLTIGARSYLHATTAAATASGTGTATLAIAPMLRAIPAAAAALNFAQPVVEGYIQGRSEDWTIDMVAWVGLPAFTVMEAT